MVKDRYTQRFPLGTRVIKHFTGYRNPFEGSVDHHSDQTDFYHVSYDDGDSEEMTEDDVEMHLLCVPKPQTLLKPQKTFLRGKTYTARKLCSPSAKVERCSAGSTPVAAAIVPSVTNLDGNKRQTVLSLNANAPGLLGSSGNSGSSSSCAVASEPPLTVCIPAYSLKEAKEDEVVENDDMVNGEDEEEEDEVVNSEDEEEEDDALLEGTPEQINLLIGKPVTRTIVKEGCGDVLEGTVASYFPATKMFRVMYFDGECCDLSYQQLLDIIPADSRPIRSSGMKKRKIEKKSWKMEKKMRFSASSSSPKWPQTLDLIAPSSATKVAGRTKQSFTVYSPSCDAQSPLTPVVRETDMMKVDNVEYNIVRKVLFIIVSTVSNVMMEVQLEVLSSADLKDKEALEVFVQKGGLISLIELLSKWEGQEETQQGVLLILKALAVLPGVTKDVIMDSRIGKKVRGIEKSQFYRDPTIPSLATWVIQKLKADVVAQQAGQGLSPSVNSEAERNQNDYSRKSGPKPGSFSMRSDGRQDDCPVSAKSTVSPRSQDTTRSKGNPLSQSNGGSKQSKSASHLLDLMNSRNGRDTSSSCRDRDIFGNIVGPRKPGKLGTARNWRARRSTVVLDQVSKRLNENVQEIDIVKTKKVENDDWKPSRISFALNDSVCAFDKEVAVSKLLVFCPYGSTKAPERVSIKRHSGPLRSILRAGRSPRTTPENMAQVVENNSAPPTVNSGAYTAVDLNGVSHESSNAASKAGPFESFAFHTSRLLNVVSPTEKRRTDFSPPPSVPSSEQTPLDLTGEADDGSIYASCNSSKKVGSPRKRPQEPKPAKAVTMHVPGMSPIVSDDDISENEKQSGANSAAKSDVAGSSTGSECGVAAGIESSYVQQTATIPTRTCSDIMQHN